MEIEVGDYIKDIFGRIGKIKSYSNGTYFTEKFGASSGEIVKPSSKNIIDLIEIGDYVNGVLIEEIQVLQGKKCLFYDLQLPMEVGLHFFMEKDIKSIVTKEQLKSVEYRLEE